MLVSASITHPSPPFPGPPLPAALMSQWDLSTPSLPPLLCTDHPCTHSLLASPLFTFFQVPKTPRLDGATREEGTFPLGN